MSTIVLTGATKGIGRAWCRGLPTRALRNRLRTFGRAIAELEREFPAPNNFTAVDVVDDDQVRAWAERAIECCGPADVLINNAGLINELAPTWKVPRAEFDKVFDVNVKGVANVIRHFVPAMIRHGTGLIVNLSSGWGRSRRRMCRPMWPASSPSKA